MTHARGAPVRARGADSGSTSLTEQGSDSPGNEAGMKGKRSAAVATFASSPTPAAPDAAAAAASSPTAFARMEAAAAFALVHS
eukprot:364568-Chlamydomonas_euryale.AAC.13